MLLLAAGGLFDVGAFGVEFNANNGLFVLLPDACAAAAAANAAAANGFAELANEFPFKKAALLMNGERPFRLNNISWAAAADDGNAAIAAVAGQKFCIDAACAAVADR